MRLYIVNYQNNGTPLYLDEDRVLWFHFHGTLFLTYEQARNAIRRTRRYIARRGFLWEKFNGTLQIRSLVEYGVQP